jgi:hypothetical protein
MSTKRVPARRPGVSTVPVFYSAHQQLPAETADRPDARSNQDHQDVVPILCELDHERPHSVELRLGGNPEAQIRPALARDSRCTRSVSEALRRPVRRRRFSLAPRHYYRAARLTLHCACALRRHSSCGGRRRRRRCSANGGERAERFATRGVVSAVGAALTVAAARRTYIPPLVALAIGGSSSMNRSTH